MESGRFTVGRALRDTAIAVALGTVISMCGILPWLAFGPEANAFWNPLSEQTAWRLDVTADAPEAERLVADARRAVAAQGHARVVVRDGRTWLEVAAPRETALHVVGDVVRPSGLWDGTVRTGRVTPGPIPPEALENAGVGIAFLLGGLAAAFLLCGLWWRPHSPPPDPTATSISWRGRLALGLGGGALLVGLAWALSWLLGLLGMPQVEQPIVKALSSAGLPTRLAFGVVVVLLAPLAEEVFFRGHIFRRLAADGSKQSAYAVSALLFAAVHFHPIAIPTYLLYGALLAWLYARARTLVVPILAHMTVNAVAFALLIRGAT